MSRVLRCNVTVRWRPSHRARAEAVVKRESHRERRRLARPDSAAALLMFRSPWLVLVGALPSALSLLVVLGLLGFHRRDALGSRDRRVGDAVWPRRGRRRAAVCHAPAGAGRRAVDRRAAIRSPWRTLREHAARHVDDGGHVSGAGGRRFSQPGAAGPVDRVRA